MLDIKEYRNKANGFSTSKKEGDFRPPLLFLLFNSILELELGAELHCPA